MIIKTGQQTKHFRATVLPATKGIKSRVYQLANKEDE